MILLCIGCGARLQSPYSLRAANRIMAAHWNECWEVGVIRNLTAYGVSLPESVQLARSGMN